MVWTGLKNKEVNKPKLLKLVAVACLCLTCVAKTHAEASSQPPTEPSDGGSQATVDAPREGEEAEQENSRWLRMPEVDYGISPRTGLDVNLANDTFTIHAGGRLYLDAVQYFEDKNDLGDTPIALRTAQLDVLGGFLSNWRYKFSWSGFTKGGSGDGGGVALGDAYVSYTGFSPKVITVGQQDEPFSLVSENSGLTRTFMENALPNALTPGKTLGISMSTVGKNDKWNAKGGMFFQDLATDKDTGDQGTGFTGRLVYRPIIAEEKIFHVGGSFSFRDITSDDTVRFRSRPESGITNKRLVDTRSIQGVDALNRFGVETAAVFGPYTFQGEYIRAFVDRRSSFEDLDFHGWYASLSWFLTGESKNYDTSSGLFGTIRPHHEDGAIELAVRYSHIDLSSEEVRGGKQDNVTLGVNWYLTEQLRIMANFIFVWTDKNATGEGDVEGNDSPQILQMRLQYSL